jgi:hypothetical protein
MPIYECERCLYFTAHKGRYTDHLLTKKHALLNLGNDGLWLEWKNKYDDLLIKYNALLIEKKILDVKVNVA